MRVLAYEYAVGGGFLGQLLDPSILPEGYAMLKSFSQDLRKAGHQLYTVVDHRVKDKLTEVFSRVEVARTREEAWSKLCRMLEEVDAAFVVAPATGGEHHKLVELVAKSRAQHLGSSPKAVEVASNKYRTCEALAKQGVPVPKSIAHHPQMGVEGFVERVLDEIGLPAVVKPVDGVGCSGLSLVENPGELVYAYQRACEAGEGEVIAQEYVEGVHASISAIGGVDGAILVSVNLQLLTLSPPLGESTYLGGFSPYRELDWGEVEELVQSVWKAIPGLRGFFGIDLVFGKESPKIVEVNPRLTTPYVVLRRICRQNLAELVVEAVVEEKLPEQVLIEGFGCVAKPSKPPVLNAAGVDIYAPKTSVSLEAPPVVAVWSKSLEEVLAKAEEVFGAQVAEELRRLLRQKPS